MKDDEILQGVLAAARDETKASRADDVAWSALAHGTLDDAELARLHERAETDAEVARGLAVFQPFDPSFEEDVAKAFLASPTAAAAAPAPAPSARAGASGPEPATSNVVPLALPRRSPQSPLLRRAASIGAPLALAAGVALFVGLRGKGASGDGLPLYELSVQSNAQASRAGEPQAVTREVRLHPHAFFDAVARPAVPATGPVVARTFLVRDGHAQPWIAPQTVSADGAVVLSGPAEKLFPSTTGAYDVVVAIARPGELPSDDAMATCALNTGRCDARVARIRVLFVAE